MRRWLLLGAGVLLLLVLVAAWAVSRLDAYLQANRAAFAAQASARLGRTVSFDGLALSLRGPARIEITGLRIDDDPRYASAPFLEAESAAVELSLFAALRGVYRLRAVAITAPTLTLIRDAQGWNVASLLAAADPALPPPPSGGGGSTPPASPPAAAGAGVALDAARLSDGHVRIIDRRRTPPLELTVDQVGLSLRDWHAGGVPSFNASAALFGAATPNATVTGSLAPGAPANADVHLTWSDVALADLAPFLPQLAGRGLQGTTSGDVTAAGPPGSLDTAALRGSITLQDIGVDDPRLPLPLSAFNGTLQLAADAVTLEQATARLGGAPLTLTCRAAPPAAPLATCQVALPALVAPEFGALALRDAALEVRVRPLDPAPALSGTLRAASGEALGAAFRDLAAEAALSGDRLDVSSFAVALFDGALRGTGHCALAAQTAPACEVDATASGVRLGPLLASQGTASAERVDGVLDASSRLTFTAGDRAVVRRSLRGGGPLRVRNGVVRGVNLAQRVLGGLPGIGELARPGSRIGALFGSSETRFDALSATLRFADGRVATRDAQATAPDFTVQASGSVGYAGDLRLTGTFHAAPPLVSELLGGVPLLGGIARSSKGLITIPFTVAGTIDEPTVEPNLGAVAGGVSREAAAGVEALFGAPDPKRGKPGGVLRRGFEDLFGR